MKPDNISLVLYEKKERIQRETRGAAVIYLCTEQNSFNNIKKKRTNSKSTGGGCCWGREGGFPPLLPARGIKPMFFASQRTALARGSIHFLHRRFHFD